MSWGTNLVTDFTYEWEHRLIDTFCWILGNLSGNKATILTKRRNTKNLDVYLSGAIMTEFNGPPFSQYTRRTKCANPLLMGKRTYLWEFPRTIGNTSIHVMGRLWVSEGMVCRKRKMPLKNRLHGDLLLKNPMTHQMGLGCRTPLSPTLWVSNENRN